MSMYNERGDVTQMEGTDRQINQSSTQSSECAGSLTLTSGSGSPGGAILGYDPLLRIPPEVTAYSYTAAPRSLVSGVYAFPHWLG